MCVLEKKMFVKVNAKDLCHQTKHHKRCYLSTVEATLIDIVMSDV